MDTTGGLEKSAAASPRKGMISTDEWLEEMIEMHEVALKGNRAKISLKDIVIRAENPEVKREDLRPTSPATVEAFMNLGIDLEEIRKVPLEMFVGEDPEIQQIYHDHYETVRKQKIAALEAERKRIVRPDDAPGTSGRKGRPGSATAGSPAGGGEDQVERERKRLEVSRRRNMQQLEQMVNYEVTRHQIQQRQEQKMKVFEEKIHEKEEEKKSREHERRMKQRELELKRIGQDEEREREAERLAQKWYQEEQERLRQAREKEQRLKKEREEEERMRRERQEKARLETQRLLEQQEAAVEARRREMEARDRVREEKERQKRRELAQLNEEKRMRAEERRKKTLQQNEEKLRQRREEFRRKEKEAAEARGGEGP